MKCNSRTGVTTLKFNVRGTYEDTDSNSGAVLLLANGGAPARKRLATQNAQARDWALSSYIGIADFEGEEKPDPYQPGVTHKMNAVKQL